MVASCGSSCTNTGTKSNISDMDAREICNDKVLLNRSRAGARWASMTKLDDKPLLL